METSSKRPDSMLKYNDEFCNLYERAMVQSRMGLLSVLSVPMRYTQLFQQMVRREVLARYRGSVLGLAWAFLTPLLTLGVYTFVLVGVFQFRWPGLENAGGSAFAMRIFAGLMVFNFFTEVIGRAPNLFVEQPNLVKKVPFPLELLPFVVLASGAVHFAANLLILLIGAFFTTGTGETWRLLLIPVVFAPLVPMLLGLSWLLASLGVYIRDLAQVVTMLMSLLMFLSPIFYSLESVKSDWHRWMMLNPMTPVIENLRAVVFLNTPIDWSAWLFSCVAGLLVAWLGARVFVALRQGFADVL